MLQTVIGNQILSNSEKTVFSWKFAYRKIYWYWQIFVIQYWFIGYWL